MRILSIIFCCLVSLYAFFWGTDRFSTSLEIATVEFWYPWGGEAGRQLLGVVDRFNQLDMRTEDGRLVRVRPVFAQSDSSGCQKFFIAEAGGKPPDVIMVASQMAEYAHRGSLRELSDLFARFGLHERDFLKTAWQQNRYRDGIYGLPFAVDPNFGFFWNKAVFREAGLPVDEPPRTITEFDRLAKRLTKVDDHGVFHAIGAIPWGVYGLSNSMYTWGWVFGGRFYDYERDRVTCNEERIVAALRWMASYAERYDVGRITAASAGFGGAEQDPFILGQLAMRPTVCIAVRQLERYAPWLEYGVGPMPYPDSEQWGRGDPDSAWIGGWNLCIPREAAEPEAATMFMKWICASDAGTTAIADATGSFPGWLHSSFLADLASDAGATANPARHALLHILYKAKHIRPSMPVQAYYHRELERAVSEVLYNGADPQLALDRAAANVQRALDKALTLVALREAAESR